jgi:uncharacterized protein YjbI with pentapeptide repeats
VLTVLRQRDRTYEKDDQRLDLSGTDLRGANLRDAQLQGASLQGAQLQEAQLQDARLKGAILWQAQLQKARLTFAQLQRVIVGDDLTHGPEGYEIVAHSWGSSRSFGHCCRISSVSGGANCA